MSEEASDDVYETTSAALRRLSDDIADFRNPEVRGIITQLPPPLPSAGKPPLPSENPAELKARLIAAHTALHEANESLELAKANGTESRKRAARAEGQLYELRAQLEDKEQEHAGVVKRASERITTLENENINASKIAVENSLLLAEAVERGRAGSATVLSERDASVAELRAARQQVESLKRDLTATRDALALEKRDRLAEKDASNERIQSLEKEVQYSRRNVDKMADVSTEELKSQGEIVANLQKEAVELRTELASRSEEAIRLQRELRASQHSFIELQERFSEAEKSKKDAAALISEVEQLRKQVAQSQASEHHLAALASEKEELSRLICALSPTGDPQAALSILRKSAYEPGAADSSPVGQVRALMQTHQREIAELQKSSRSKVIQLEAQLSTFSAKLGQAEAERAAAIAEMEEEKAAAKRNKVMRKILQREKNHLHAALDEIERDLEKSPETDNSLSRLRERCKASEQTATEYKSTMEEFEKSLVECQKEIRDLKSQLAVATARRGTAVSDSATTNDLKCELQEALEKASEAQSSRVEAELAAKRAESRLSEVQEQLQELKLQEAEKDLSTQSGELDYDPAVTKVFHFCNNPLRKAMTDAKVRRDSAAGKKRLRMDIDASLSPPRHGDSPASVVALYKEIESLSRRNSELEKLSKVGKRTGEIAKRKIEEIRAAVYNIFGWSMRVTGAKYTLSSIYAEAQSDFLEFGINEKGTMSLLETDYTSRLAEEIEEYVQKRNSFPALLATITIDNFNQTTAIIA